MTVLTFAACCALTIPTPDRSLLSLDGRWKITTDDPASAQAHWVDVEVPAEFETALGTSFDGVATYRRSFVVPADFRGERLLLQFDGAATEARVSLNGVELGSHVGAWTPFRLDATTVVKRGATNVLEVRLDEKVGHNTQGFLPIIAPHFGGLWQSVKLVGVPRAWIDDLALGATSFGATSFGATSIGLRLSAPIRGDATGLHVEWELAGDASQEPTKLAPNADGEATIQGMELWSPDSPRLHPLVARLVDGDGRELDRVSTRVGLRDVRADGTRIRLNGAPLSIRGFLEWGYWPPHLAPNPSDEVFRREIADAKARGFDLVKFCLWEPPARLLDLLDEAGMLAWIEYPTWHPTIDEAHHAELAREYDEFFRHDRNHPCVVVRSLTCETGPSASLEVLKDLYARAHSAIPGAIVEDDSSWISWNRVSDVWDEHPYGNRGWFVQRLGELNSYVKEHGAKPLLLGEAIAADTWVDRSALESAAAASSPSKPWWLPKVFAAQTTWEQRIAVRFGAATVAKLGEWSLRFAMNQRKDEIEAFRQLVPDGGYVVSVARDFTGASMGLNDPLDRPKWSPDEWSFQRPTTLALGADVPRAYASGSHATLPLFLSHFGSAPLRSADVSWSWRWPASAEDGARSGGGARSTADGSPIAPGSLLPCASIALDVPKVARPTPTTVEITLRDANAADAASPANRVRIWAVPEPAAMPDDVAVVHALTPKLLHELEEGAKVLLLASGERGSFTVQSFWFLRGAPWFPPHPVTEVAPPEFFLDLVDRDLEPDGVLPIAPIFGRVDPIVAVWDTHDRAEVVDHALVFETRVGKGRLLVSALPTTSRLSVPSASNHDGAAGAWLVSLLAHHLSSGPAPQAALADLDVRAIEDALTAKVVDLTAVPWDFRPGVEGDWKAETWTKIKVGAHWEGQGFPDLDGWATYRLALDVPADFDGEPLYLNFEGVDDAFELDFDGARVGSGGDIPTRRTAFDERSTHLLTKRASAGSKHTIEVRVLDWQGAGGIHRPVTLSTRPRSEATEYLNTR
jgi:hypothetical protein